MLDVHTRYEGHQLRITLAGELVLETAGDLHAELATVPAHVSGITLDCQQLTFLDSTGVSALLRLVRICKERGATLDIAGVQSDLHDALDVMGFFDLLPPK